MHANDLILMSETSNGLQNCLEKLRKYCFKWGLSVYTNKTK